MVGKRPIGDKTPTEHLHALRLEFGTKPETLPLLKHIFEDSLAPHIAALLSSENITDIDTYADRASELYILCEPVANNTVAKVAISEVTFANEELLQTLKNLTNQVASLTSDYSTFKEQNSQLQNGNIEISQLNQQPQATYRQTPRPQYEAQPQASYLRQPALAQFRHPAKFSPQIGSGQVWRSQANSNGQFTRPPRDQQSGWRAPTQPSQNYNISNDFTAPINRQGLCPYHEHFGNQARNCRPGCIYYATSNSVASNDFSEN